MKTNIFIYITLIASLISCKPSTESEIPIIDCTKFIHRDVKLSEFVADLSYIKLSPEITMQNICDVQFCGDSEIYISMYPSLLAVYNYEGNLIRKLGSEGKGPGEYKYCDFTLDRENRRVFIYDDNILVYSLDGVYKNSINVASYDKIDMGFDIIGYKNDQIYLFQDIDFGEAQYNWLILNVDSKEYSEKLNSIPSFKSTCGSLGNIMYEFNNHFCYWNHLNDTIFELLPDNAYKARYLFAKNDKRLTSKNFVSNPPYEKEDILDLRCLFESEKYLFLTYSQKCKSGYCIYKKHEKQFYTVEENWQITNQGFTNDFDGGMNFEPRFFATINNEEYLIGWKNAYQIKDFASSSDLKNSEVIDPQKKKDFEELANSLKENDNPVLMLVKLKQ